jgi:DNA-binding IclR family transcriptional regulator
MNNAPMPDAVRRFVLTSIPSVPYLEALLLLRAGSTRAWAAKHAAERLYIGERDAEELLATLEQAGIATREAQGFRYAPRSPELVEVIDALATTYSQNLVGVTDLIHSRVEKRAQRFADAFRWKKEGN